MKKLYKVVDGVMRYHEAWGAEGKVIEHWGLVGERGEQRSHDLQRTQSEDEAIEAILSKARADGFEEIEDNDLITILIEYHVDGMGSSEDVDKRHALEDRMNETLGWTGLGHCDGGSIGSGSMEVCCLVVDSKIAIRVIAEDLKGTTFEDYTRIFEE